MEHRTVQELPKEVQEQNLRDLQHQITTKVQADARPKVSYRVTCYACEQEYYIDMVGKTHFSNTDINTYLTANGWLIGGRGYECYDCWHSQVRAVVDYVTRDRPSKVVEGTATEVNPTLELEP